MKVTLFGATGKTGPYLIADGMLQVSDSGKHNSEYKGGEDQRHSGPATLHIDLYIRVGGAGGAAGKLDRTGVGVRSRATGSLNSKRGR